MHRIPVHGRFCVDTDCAEFATFLSRLYTRRTLGGVGDSSGDRAAVVVLRHAGLPPQTDIPGPDRDERIVVQRDTVMTEFQRTGYRRRLPDGGARTLIPDSGTLVTFRGLAEPVLVHSPCQEDRPDIIAQYKTDDAFRTVRHTLYLYLLRTGYTWCHGACIDRQGDASLIIGESRAGKTSTMIRLLRDGDHAFLTNGRSFLRAEDGAEVTVEALPELVQLRQGLLADDPWLRECLGAPVPEIGSWTAPEATKRPVFSTDLARALGVTESYRARVSRLIFPLLSQGPREVPPSLGRDRALKVISGNLFDTEYIAEYNWFENPGRPAFPPGRIRVTEALASLPRWISYLDRDAAIVLREVTDEPAA